ncbi:MAG: hypothetical protein IBGAMO2_650002 [Arenicellales bacterium IbO2]|nr:MAG: hypothetical protein IBGAMO2_650002 [Arenicellales bacterium IbO2]
MGLRGSGMRQKLFAEKIRLRGSVEYIRWVGSGDGKKPKLPKIK